VNTQPLPSLWRVYITAAVCVFFAGAYTALGTSPPPFVLLITYYATPVSAVLWLQRDARVHKVATVHDWGMFAFIAWPVMIPWYTIKTRGVGSGLPLAAALLLPVLAAPFVYLLGTLVRGGR
jgi:hypothetical protein